MPRSKQVIAIDMDEVLVETSKNILNYYNNRFGTSVLLKNYYSQNPKIWKAPDMSVVSARLNSYLETDAYIKSGPVKLTIDTIRALEEKYKLYIVTGRPNTMEVVTRKWVDRHFPDIFQDVIFASWLYKNERTKGEICVELGVSTLIDDHLTHILDASKYGVNGLFFGNFPWNETDRLPKNVTRVKGWKEIAEILL